MKRRMRNTGQCETENCTSKASCAGLCTACYSWHYHWKSQGVAAAQRYRRKVKRITSRLRAMLPEVKQPVARKNNGAKQHKEERAYMQ